MGSARLGLVGGDTGLSIGDWVLNHMLYDLQPGLRSWDDRLLSDSTGHSILFQSPRRRVDVWAAPRAESGKGSLNRL